MSNNEPKRASVRVEEIYHVTCPYCKQTDIVEWADYDEEHICSKCKKQSRMADF